MLKQLSLTILLVNAPVLLTTEVALSRPERLSAKYPVVSKTEASTPVCYLRTPSGRTLDLTGMCGDNLAKVTPNYQPAVYNATPPQNPVVPNRGAIRGGTVTTTTSTGGNTTPYGTEPSTGGTNIQGTPRATNAPPVTLGAPGSNSLVAPGASPPPSTGNLDLNSVGGGNSQGGAGVTTTNTNSNRVINSLGAPGTNSLGGSGGSTTP